MSAAVDAEARARLEIGRSPDVFFVLVTDGSKYLFLNTLYAVLLPQDAKRFRIRKESRCHPYGVDFKLRNRWWKVTGVWRQFKGRNYDPAENRPVAVPAFAKFILEKLGVKHV